MSPNHVVKQPAVAARPTRFAMLTLLVMILPLAGCLDRELPAAPPVAAPAFDEIPVGCSAAELIAAIEAANADSGPDVIELDGNCTYELSTPYAGDNGLPVINSDITINGNGATIRRSTAQQFRIIDMTLDADLTLNEVHIINGGAEGFGGGIRNNAGDLTILNSSILLNSVMAQGAGIYNGGNLVVLNSTFAGNSALDEGGAIFNAGELLVANSTFLGNVASRGGAIFTQSSPTIMYSTIAGNFASTRGGGVFVASGSATITSSILALNEAEEDPDLSGDAVGGSNLISVDPGLEQDTDGRPWLTGNGGPTLTIALLPSSPAIGAGDDEACASVFVNGVDQRGVGRPQPAGGRCDIGAFELESTDATAPVITPQVSGTLGENGWYTSDVVVSWSVVDDESGITVQDGCGVTNLTTDTEGTTLTCEATSAGGTATRTVTISIDKTAPTLSPTVTPDPVVLNGNATASPGATDALSGIASQSCNPVSTSTLGNQTVQCTATDHAGNTANASVGYTVTYGFSGFAAPINNDGANVARAGRTIPLVWRLLDHDDMPITDLASVAMGVTTLQCDLDDSVTPLPDEDVAGKSGLQNLGDGFYQFNWKTPKSYAGSCLMLQLDMGEGITRTAEFHFTK